MNLRLPFGVLIFVSSYSPLAMILAIQDFDSEIWSNGGHFFRFLWTFKHPIAVWSILGLVLLSCLVCWMALRFVPAQRVVRIRKAKNKSADLMDYSLPYVASFFGIDFSQPKSWVTFCVFLLVMLVLTIRSYRVFSNPLLPLLGFHLYEVEYSEGSRTAEIDVLSKEELKAGHSYRVEKITPFLLIGVALKEGKNGPDQGTEEARGAAQEAQGTRPPRHELHFLGDP